MCTPKAILKCSRKCTAKAAVEQPLWIPVKARSARHGKPDMDYEYDRICPRDILQAVSFLGSRAHRDNDRAKGSAGRVLVGSRRLHEGIHRIDHVEYHAARAAFGSVDASRRTSQRRAETLTDGPLNP